MPEDLPPAPPLWAVQNLAPPVRLTDVRIDGIAVEAGMPGNTVKIMARGHTTTDEPLFHLATKGLAGIIADRARVAGAFVRPDQSNCLLVVIHADYTADLWDDTAAIAHNVLAKKPFQPGQPVFEGDIADIIGMRFNAVEILPTDKVICIFREGWRFALFVDFNSSGNFKLLEMERDLGTLVRRMRYADLYDAVANDALFGKVIEAGWFPFVEIIGAEFTELLNQSKAGFPLADVESKLLAKFDKARIEHLLERWMGRPHFAAKKPLLDSAMKAFQNGDPVAVLKIVLTEIEGILNDAYFLKTGRRTSKIQKLLAFAIESAETRAGSPDTLLFPAAFGRYLRDYVFRSFDPAQGGGEAGSRHAVGHGAAEAGTYTMIRALQALLTLDQLAFYTAADPMAPT